MLDKNLLAPFFSIPIKKQATKKRVWFYQHSGEDKQQINREGKWWYYNSPAINGGGEVGCDSLNDAKGDLLYSGAKVWSELI